MKARHLANPQIELTVIERVGKSMAVLTNEDQSEWYSAELENREGIWYAGSVNGYGDRWTALENAAMRDPWG